RSRARAQCAAGLRPPALLAGARPRIPTEGESSLLLMATLRFTTAGESHGPGLVAIVEGLPAGLEVSREELDRDLARRQLGPGRGGRMKIESDRAEVTAGLRHGRTLGSPVAIRVANRDFANWEGAMNPWSVDGE